MKSNLSLILCFVLACSTLQAEDATTPVRVGMADGQVQGQLFAMLGDQKAPLVGKVALTDTDGKTVSVAQSDEEGQFTFVDVVPGNYKAIGIAGDFVGNADVEVLSIAVSESDEAESEGEDGVYTAIPLPVAQASSSAIFDTYSSLPMNSFSTAPSLGVTNVGGGGASYGGCGCGCGCSSSFGRGGGGFNFRRLALLGAAVAIPVALSGGNDDVATPSGT